MAKNKGIRLEIARVQHGYLDTAKTKAQRSLKGCVKHIVETLLKPALRGNVDVSEVVYAGSHYEHSALHIPSNSDFDLQFCLDLSNCQKKPHADSSGSSGKMKVKGGPAHLCDDDGYLSASTVRRKILSSVDKKLASISLTKFQGYQVQVTRSHGAGPAAILNVTWREESFSIDVVARLSWSDVNGLRNRENLIAKNSAWIKSYSEKETDLMERFQCTSGGRRTLRLYKVIKTIKAYVPQLKQLSSFFYKNVLFHLQAEYSDARYWRNTKQLTQRYKNMIDKIYDAVRDRRLMVYFHEPGVEYNYLSWYEDNGDLENLANFLEGIISRGDYISLLERIP